MQQHQTKLVLQVVYTSPTPPESLLAYKSSLELLAPGSVVKLVPAEPDLGCPLQAQLIRLVAFKLKEVDPNDIVVTADVDAFVTSPKVTLPLTALSERKVIGDYYFR